MNTLYYGDNLDVLRRHIKDETVDLIYLDPPFKSNQDYNVLFKEESGERAAAQILAFEDTWHWDAAASKAYEETVLAGGKVADVMRAFQTFLGGNDMLAYLAMMAPRLVELRRVLKPTGSIYLHCDPTASHYLKLLMDAVFGPTNYLNEIIWKRSLPHGNIRKSFGRAHDVILFYSKEDVNKFIQQYDAHREEYVEQFYRFYDNEGRRYRLVSCINPNPNRPNLTYEWKGVTKVWKWTKERMKESDKKGLLVYSKTGIPSYKNYLDEMKGTAMQDVWETISPLMGSSAERLGYPTQKPEALLERIIKASSNEGDVVLDPFCGCGTAVAVAQKLNRQWIGIDITHLAITLIKKRLKDQFGAEKDTPPTLKKTPPTPPVNGGESESPSVYGGVKGGTKGKDASSHLPSVYGGAGGGPKFTGGQGGSSAGLLTYRVIGEPTALEDAKQLAEDDKYQFQWWALGLVDARPVEQKKGADQGIDGRRYFMDGQNRRTEQVIFSVKAGHVTASQLRDLRGVVEREKAAVGVLITMEPSTKPMKKEAADAGFYHSDYQGTKHPRIQILTIEELLDGAKVDLPVLAFMPSQDATFKKAPKSKGKKRANEKLDL